MNLYFLAFLNCLLFGIAGIFVFFTIGQSFYLKLKYEWGTREVECKKLILFNKVFAYGFDIFIFYISTDRLRTQYC